MVRLHGKGAAIRVLREFRGAELAMAVAQVVQCVGQCRVERGGRFVRRHRPARIAARLQRAGEREPQVRRGGVEGEQGTVGVDGVVETPRGRKHLAACELIAGFAGRQRDRAVEPAERVAVGSALQPEHAKAKHDVSIGRLVSEDGFVERSGAREVAREVAFFGQRQTLVGPHRGPALIRKGSDGCGASSRAGTPGRRLSAQASRIAVASLPMFTRRNKKLRRRNGFRAWWRRGRGRR